MSSWRVSTKRSWFCVWVDGPRWPQCTKHHGVSFSAWPPRYILPGLSLMIIIIINLPSLSMPSRQNCSKWTTNRKRSINLFKGGNVSPFVLFFPRSGHQLHFSLMAFYQLFLGAKKCEHKLTIEICVSCFRHCPGTSKWAQKSFQLSET